MGTFQEFVEMDEEQEAVSWRRLPGKSLLRSSYQYVSHSLISLQRLLTIRCRNAFSAPADEPVRIDRSFEAINKERWEDVPPEWEGDC